MFCVDKPIFAFSYSEREFVHFVDTVLSERILDCLFNLSLLIISLVVERSRINQSARSILNTWLWLTNQLAVFLTRVREFVSRVHANRRFLSYPTVCDVCWHDWNSVLNDEDAKMDYMRELVFLMMALIALVKLIIPMSMSILIQVKFSIDKIRSVFVT